MNKRVRISWTALTLVSAVAGLAGADDDVGVVHVSDGKPVVAASASSQTPPPATVPTTPAGPAAPAPANGVVAGAPADATCDCGPGACRPHPCLCNYNAWVTSGFGRPIASPITKEAVVYYHYWPLKWYGEPGWALTPQFPMVYMPTDTTQLGFYYSRVPQWLPNPAMYPHRPNPAEWNRRDYTPHGWLCDHGVAAGGCPPIAAGAVVGPPATVAPNVAPPGAVPAPSPVVVPPGAAPNLAPVPSAPPSASNDPSAATPQQRVIEMPMPPAPAESNSVVPTNAGAQTGTASTAVGH
jgi:hypothetical protein